MEVLLVRATVPNERFGLGPFFRIEPLGMEYLAAALRKDGHEVNVYDLRFSAPLSKLLRRHRPRLVGVASAHTLDIDSALAVVRAVKQWDPAAFTVVGGHSAAVFPEPLEVAGVDAICLEDGEAVLPALVRALEQGAPLTQVPGLRLPTDGGFASTPAGAERIDLDAVPLPARDALRSGHRHYLCIQRKPVYLIETSRGCPYRCSFCTIWQHVDRSFRVRSIDAVCQDLQSVGENVFVADDLFGYPAERSLELAHELRRRGIRKKWMLIQTRTDLVARHPELLAAWNDVVDQLDVFFGFESPTNDGLDGLSKDSTTADIEEALRVCRELGVGPTGNFIVDPDWDEDGFQNLWDFTDRLQMKYLGFTILTPLPGTSYYDEVRSQIEDRDWAHFDMHHILWEPRLGRERFFELFAETWRRSALNTRGDRSVTDYLRQIRPSQIPFLVKVLLKTQRLFDAKAYLKEAFPRRAKAASGVR